MLLATSGPIAMAGCQASSGIRHICKLASRFCLRCRGGCRTWCEEMEREKVASQSAGGASAWVLRYGRSVCF